MKYGFMSKDGVEYKCEDCELKRFKFWWRLCGRKEMRYGYVELDSGEIWIWGYYRYRWRWESLGKFRR